MGYRSDVRIRTTKEGYEVMKKFVENYVKEKELKVIYKIAQYIVVQ